MPAGARCQRLSATACRDVGKEDEELTPWKEQENWEAHQVAKASMAAGARDRKASAPEYDFVLPDAVEFITAQAIQGTLVRLLANELSIYLLRSRPDADVRPQALTLSTMPMYRSCVLNHQAYVIILMLCAI